MPGNAAESERNARHYGNRSHHNPLERNRLRHMTSLFRLFNNTLAFLNAPSRPRPRSAHAESFLPASIDTPDDAP
jgi:hypothetical protein